MTVFVFLGPTLTVAEAQAILPDATFLPPAAQSDILSVVEQSRPDAILLIDGVFTQALSVWHKEILYALEHGVAVYGASSMGALRVAETAVFGAVGMGRIYEAFASGELTDDDEVAVTCATAEWGFRAQSEAMVNIRASLAAARDAGVVDAAAHDRLVGLAKGRFFPERSFPQLLEDAAAAGFDQAVLAALRAFLRTGAVDQKREDALTLLTHIRDHGVTPPAPVTVTRSHPFQALYHRDRRVQRKGVQVPLSDISSWAALHLAEFRELNEHALHASLVNVLGELLGIEADAQAVTAERRRFCQDQRLGSEDELMRWRLDNDLTESELEAFLGRQAVRRRLRDWFVSRKYLERTTQDLLDELRLRRRYPETADAAAAQQKVLDGAYPDFESRGDDTGLVELIRDHARETRWRPSVAIETWAFESGFKDVSDVRYELVRARLARRATASAMESLTGAGTSGPVEKAPGDPGSPPGPEEPRG